MRRIVAQAERYCKKLNSYVKASQEYNEAVLYAKFGGSIGIKRCSEIAQKYCA